MSLLAVQQKVDCLANLLVFDLSVKVLVHDLGTLLGGDVGEQIGAQIPGYGHVIRGPRITGGVDESGVQAKQNVRLNFAGTDLHGIDAVAVQKVDCLRHHFHVTKLLRSDVQKQVLDFGVLNAKALGHILHSGLQFAVAAAQLLLQKRRILRIRSLDFNGVEKHLFVFEHIVTSKNVVCGYSFGAFAGQYATGVQNVGRPYYALIKFRFCVRLYGKKIRCVGRRIRMNRFDEVRFCGTFRSYQQRVLDHAEQYLDDGKINIVAAPGSGKTVLGLELVRRLGEPCLILSPTTAIREQWGQRFRDLFLVDENRFGELFSNDLHRMSLVNSITYQALYSAMEKVSVSEEDEVDCSDVDLLNALKEYHIKTVCLDEAHHLKNEWQKALEKFVSLLDSDVKMISLTATPPYDSEAAEWKRYYDICGEIDEEIFVPELVGQDTLCPHQDYIFFNYPTKEEIAAFAAYQENATKAVDAICHLEYVRSLPVVLTDREHKDTVFEAPGDYIAVLIMLQQSGVEVSRKLIKSLTGKKTLPNMTRKHAQKALQFLVSDECVVLSEEQKEEVVSILKEHQVYFKRKVSLELNEALRRDLISSVGKLKSIERIADNEYAALGKSLRMLVLTDFIQRENLSKVATTESFSNINVVSIFETIRRTNDAVNIGVLSGSLVILPQSVVLEGIKHTRSDIVGTRYCEVKATGSNHTLIEAVGELFRRGEIQILVGTKSLLGEGWDAPCINSLILASFVGSYVSSNQMRGRAIRIDKSNPDKTANVWHLVTLEPMHVVAETATQRLMASVKKDVFYIDSWDYEVLVRRFDSFMGPNYDTGAIESGIQRVTLIKPPYDEKGIERINEQMLALSARRADMKEQWCSAVVGKKFNVVIERPVTKEKRVPPYLYINWFWYLWCILFFSVSCTSVARGVRDILSNEQFFDSSANGQKLVVEWAFLGFLLMFGLWKVFSKLILHLTPAKSFKTLGKAVGETLTECGMISDGANVHVDSGYAGTDEVAFCLQLRNASMHDQNIFNMAMTELMSPIRNPRYLLIKKRATGGYQYLYSFACPTVIGRKREYAEVLAKKLAKGFGNVAAVYCHNEEGRKLLLKCRSKSYLTKEALAEEQVTRSKKYALTHFD